MLDWLKMLCRKLVKVDANICENRSVIEVDHNTDNKLAVENSALETGEDVHTVERMQEA
jgi:hypothetical protein